MSLTSENLRRALLSIESINNCDVDHTTEYNICTMQCYDMNCPLFRGHLQTDFSMLNIIMMLRGGFWFVTLIIKYLLMILLKKMMTA